MTRLSILLHGHLPFGFTGRSSHSFENAWLFEAVTESYLPLTQTAGKLNVRKIDYQIFSPLLTASLSPTLLSLWQHPEFAEAYQAHMQKLCQLAEAEAGNSRLPAERRVLAQYYAEYWQSLLSYFQEDLDSDLTAAFVQMAKEGIIELITTSATHALLPAFQHNPAVIERQIGEGIRYFNQVTGLTPQGFWLPECAYFPGLEEVLARWGVHYFAVESTALTRGNPPATASYNQPVQCPNGVRAIARNPAFSRMVWDAQLGYPGHPDYREFHRDAVHDLPKKLAAPFTLPDARTPSGLKYWAITGSEEKRFYQPDCAIKQAQQHARQFVDTLEKQFVDATDTICFLPFDMELFGHWWYEGPAWLREVLQLTEAGDCLTALSANSAINDFEKPQTCQPATSSWGNRADFSFWINPDTDWIFAQLEHAQNRLQSLSPDMSKNNPLLIRANEIASKELMLAEASDWPFMIRAGTTKDYAINRIQKHLARFHSICDMIEKEDFDEALIALLEEKDCVLG